MAQSVEDSLIVRMEASLRKFERQMEGGRVAAVKAAKGSEAAWTRAGTQIQANANRATSGIARMTQVSGAGRFVLQNTANQIGDIAVQLESGTNAFRVAGQQLPQILGGFGALGGTLGILAPLLGTVAAIGLPIAGMLFAMGDEADKADPKLKTFADRLDDTEAAIKRFQAAADLAGPDGLEALGDRFGEITDDVRELALELLEMEERAARLKIGQILDEVSASIEKAAGAVGGVDLALAQVGTEAAREQIALLLEQIAEIEQRRDAGLFVDQSEIALLAQMREELAALQGDMANLGSLADDVRLPPDLLAGLAEAQAQFAAAKDAADFEAVAKELQRIKNAMQELGDTFSQEVIDRVVQGEIVAREMAKAAEDAKAAAEGIADVDLAGGISSAASEAVRLAQALGVSLDTARKIAALGPQGKTNPVGRGRGGDPRDFGGSAFDIQNAEGTEFLANFKPPKAARGRSGGGSKKDDEPFFADAEKQIEALNRQIEMIGKTNREITEMTARYKLLDEAKKRGLDLDKEQIGTGETLRQEIDRQAETIGKLTEVKEEAAQKAQEVARLNQQMKDAFLNAAIEGEGLTGILEGLARSLARAALEAAFFKTGPLSGGGGILGGLFSGLFPNANGNAFSGGRVTPFANGGVVNSPTLFGMRGGTGLMGEAGPEAVMPLTRIGGKLGVRADGGGGTATLRIIAPEGFEVDFDGKMTGIAVEVTKAGLQQFAKNTMPGLVQKINKDPRRLG